MNTVEVKKTKVDVNLDTNEVQDVMIDDTEEVQSSSRKVVRSRSKKQIEVPDEKEKAVDAVMNNVRDRYGFKTHVDPVVPENQLNTWKKQYGEIYRTDLNDQTFIWHKLRRRDYIDIMGDESLNAIENTDLRVFMRQEKILQAGILYPTGEELENIVDMNAGVAGNISDEIMLASGFRPVRSEKL